MIFGGSTMTEIGADRLTRGDGLELHWLGFLAL